MSEVKLDHLIKECRQIQEDSTLTAEAHHLIAKKLKKRAFIFKLIPALITIVCAVLLLIGLPNWVAWIALLTTFVTILNIIIDPEKESRNHLIAAKNFTVLKHEARSLHECFSLFEGEQQFYFQARLLREKYNLFVKASPPTDDAKAFERARKNIKEGRHTADFR